MEALVWTVLINLRNVFKANLPLCITDITLVIYLVLTHLANIPIALWFILIVF